MNFADLLSKEYPQQLLRSVKAEHNADQLRRVFETMDLGDIDAVMKAARKGMPGTPDFPAALALCAIAGRIMAESSLRKAAAETDRGNVTPGFVHHGGMQLRSAATVMLQQFIEHAAKCSGGLPSDYLEMLGPQWAAQAVSWGAPKGKESE